MLARPGVFAGMLVGRAVAAQRGAAFLTGPQVEPLRIHLDALGALPTLGVFDRLDGSQMGAGWVSHGRRLVRGPVQVGWCRKLAFAREVEDDFGRYV